MGRLPKMRGVFEMGGGGLNPSTNYGTEVYLKYSSISAGENTNRSFYNSEMGGGS